MLGVPSGGMIPSTKDSSMPRAHEAGSPEFGACIMSAGERTKADRSDCQSCLSNIKIGVYILCAVNLYVQNPNSTNIVYLSNFYYPPIRRLAFVLNGQQCLYAMTRISHQIVAHYSSKIPRARAARLASYLAGL